MNDDSAPHEPILKPEGEYMVEAVRVREQGKTIRTIAVCVLIAVCALIFGMTYLQATKSIWEIIVTYLIGPTGLLSVGILTALKRRTRERNRIIELEKKVTELESQLSLQGGSPAPVVVTAENMAVVSLLEEGLPPVVDDDSLPESVVVPEKSLTEMAVAYAPKPEQETVQTVQARTGN